MTRTVEYCLSNVDAATRRYLDDREIGAEEVVEKRCLQRCGNCYQSAILVVDGELETGESHAAILSAHARDR